MIKIVIDCLGYVKQIVGIFMQGVVPVWTSSDLTIHMLTVFLFCWVVWLFLMVLRFWLLNQRR